ncbi:MAG TPA: hypothetical protein VL978_00810 [Puia sp.]|nr:hypothetical protein [Puia sp.]
MDRTTKSTLVEASKIKFDMPVFGKALAAFIRERAKFHGSFVAYMENGKLIKEDPRTGIKTEITVIDDSDRR